MTTNHIMLHLSRLPSVDMLANWCIMLAKFKLVISLKCRTVWTSIRSGQNVEPDLGPICLKGLSADDNVM